MEVLYEAMMNWDQGFFLMQVMWTHC